MTGAVYSSGFPITPGAFDTTFNGGFSDGFVTKVSTAGSALVYSTYLGGRSGDDANAIAIDAAGNAYITGITHSPDFPTTAEAFDSSYNDNGDAFVTRLDAAGSALVYSTFLGGSSILSDTGGGIALDAFGDAYVGGATSSFDFPITPGAYDESCNSCPQYGDVFITKFQFQR